MFLILGSPKLDTALQMYLTSAKQRVIITSLHPVGLEVRSHSAVLGCCFLQPSVAFISLLSRPVIAIWIAMQGSGQAQRLLWGKMVPFL